MRVKTPLDDIGPLRGLDAIYQNHLENKVNEYIEKYMDLSKNKDIRYISSGSSSDVYKIGDYVIKLARRKWSLEKVICPNSYLILKNDEEYFIREDNLIIAGIEIQKYLEKEAPEGFEDKFISSLKNEGYYYYDYLTDGEYGSNLKMLDSYLDADTIDFSKVPDWFYKNPIVLVDRDLVFKNGVEPNTLILRHNINIY